MSISNLSRTSFATTPTAGLEVVDIYSAEKFESIVSSGELSTADSELLSELYPDFPQDKLIKYLGDEKLAAHLTASGTTLKSAWSNLDLSMPNGIKKPDFLKYFTTDGWNLPDWDIPGMDIDFTDVLKWGPELKESIDISIFNDMDTETYSGFFRNLKDYKTRFDNDDVSARTTQANVWSKSLGVTDSTSTKISSVLTASNVSMFSSQFMKSDNLTDDELKTWIASELGDSEEKEAVYADLAVQAGKNGKWDLMADFIALAGDSYTTELKNKTIYSILYNYTYTSGSASTRDYLSLGNELIAQLDSLDTEWDKTLRGVVAVHSLIRYSIASWSALKVLSFTERCGIAALLTMKERPSVRSYRTLMKNDYPALLLS